MRLLAVNAVTDPALNAVRARYPGKITRNPVIGGTRLPPGRRRVIDYPCSDEIIVDLITYVRYGVLRVFAFGNSTYLTEQELIDLRPILAEGRSEPVTPNPEPELSGDDLSKQVAPPDTEPDEGDEDGRSLIAAVTDEQEEDPDAPSDDEDIMSVLDDDKTEEEDVRGPESFTLPDDLEARLLNKQTMSNRLRSSMLAQLGGKTAGKPSKKLVSEIIERLSADDLDPALGNKILDMLEEAEGAVTDG